MFDLTDLNTDSNEFNDFYNNNESQYNTIERPQNPFHKNFESYKSKDNKMNLRNSFSDLQADLLLPISSENIMRKHTSVDSNDFVNIS